MTIFDRALFNEVLDAIGVETALAVSEMFLTQSHVLLAGARSADNGREVRAESLHALKGMALQLGLSQLGDLCQETENAITSALADEHVLVLMQKVDESLKNSHSLLQEELEKLR